MLSSREAIEKKRTGILEALKQAVVEGDPEASRTLSEEAVRLGIPPYDVINEGMSQGMKVVGRLYEEKDYFLPDLILSAEAMKEGLRIVEPLLKVGKSANSGGIVIGTAAGDIHDIGKTIVATMLRSAGFTVYDLGADVPIARFVEKVKEVGADIVACSSLMSTSMPAQKELVEALVRAGVRNSVIVLIGGAPVTKGYAESIGADGYAEDAVRAVSVAEELIKARRRG